MTEKHPFLYTLKFAVAITLIVLTVLGVGLSLIKHFERVNSSTPLPVFNQHDKVRFVIDPGHGGEDAGAIADDNTLEKDLNLDIATLLYTILRLNCSDAVLTRTDDLLLYDKYGDLENYTGQKKVYDLKNRLRIAEEKENSIYVGIHINKFPSKQYSGLQVYYSHGTKISKNIAEDIRSLVATHLQPTNKRQIKGATSSIYILHNAKIPAVLIECGFLSNDEELELLKSKDYQKKLALNLFVSLSKYDN